MHLTAIILACSISLLMMSGMANATGEPSSGAKSMPGAMGTFEYKPNDLMEGKTTWWKDSDGILLRKQQISWKIMEGLGEQRVTSITSDHQQK
jgi:hypothetical protein